MALRKGTVRSITAATAAFCLTLGASACQRAADTSSTDSITNRPQTYDRFIAIVKLKTPPLLATSTRKGHKISIDQGQKAALLAEQEQAISSLQALSPDLKILYRYKLVLNGLAIVAPKSLQDKLSAIDGVSAVEADGAFTRLEPMATISGDAGTSDLNAHSSGTFIGTDQVHNDLKITGKGIIVGVIDTGIDYTHAMFGGAGTPAAYSAVVPGVAYSGFPTAKVIGGIDLVGTDYDSGSPLFANHVPKADPNPLDEAGHGSHVSGTIAGHGDGVNTYNGIAPDASLYAIKIFGKAGSTGDAVILEALEKAANPSEDLDPSDHLDVINLSIGGDFGTPHTLYREAVKNLVAKGDVAMVAAAGNSGANPYIVSNPSISDEALSVAAGIDDMPQNWKFNAIEFTTPAHASLTAEAIEATFSLPIAKAGPVKGKLVYVGLGDKDLTDAQKAALKGNVALMDRGIVAFSDKAKVAAQGNPIGLVVANNADGSPLAMGGDGTYSFPAVMITKALGDELKADMAAGGDAVIAFQTAIKIEKPELIDTITDFSSRGPRSIDGAIKPEITAPGNNVISAKMGSGDQGVQFSGTSMATPHMTGVLALLRQAHPDLDVAGLKALVMGTALAIDDTPGVPAGVAAMGAGRVQAYNAARAQMITSPSALSLGEILVGSQKVVKAPLTITNISGNTLALTLASTTKAGLAVQLPASVTLKAHESKTITVKVTLTPQDATDASEQLDGFVTITGDTVPYHVPLLAVIDRTTNVSVANLVQHASTDPKVTATQVDLTLSNKGVVSGTALPFNLLGTQPRIKSAQNNPAREGICELESAGWRLNTTTTGGATTTLLQVAVKLYNPITSWQLCDVSVLVDKTGDGTIAQELLGTALNTLSGNAADTGTFVSALTDGDKMRSLRHAYEIAPAGTAAPTYLDAVLDAQAYTPYAHGTIAVLSADVTKLATMKDGSLRLQIVVSAQTSSPSADDYLGGKTNWVSVIPTVAGETYQNLPDSIIVAPGAEPVTTFTKNGSAEDLVLYLPFDKTIQASSGKDQQQLVLSPAASEN